MIKYRDFKEIYFNKRKDFEEVDPQIDEIGKDWAFFTPFKNKCKEVHILDVHYNITWNFMLYTVYWASIGSTDPDGILGIDFIIIRYYVPSQPVMTLRKTTTFYLVQCGPSLKCNNRPDTRGKASIVIAPVSALTFKRFSNSSYSTRASNFSTFCCFTTIKHTMLLIEHYFPNLLKQPSKHKNKAYCKVNNKYIKEMKKLGLFPTNK
ncbi:hypothetical protein [Ureaplasma ceti]|uniref:Uncharacterized protein n=1 Tax=Ureaplasma ceti TaxID=3119530 RepID=A0ABP9U958_9BACT